jgi:indolepyruvate decarboxylase
MDLQRDIYGKITALSTTLLDPLKAPLQIDETIAACLRLKRPVYIEIPSDIVNAPCVQPQPLKLDAAVSSEKATLEEAVEETVAMLSKASHPVILAGVEAHRFGARKELEDFINHSGYPFATTLLGKAVIPEKHPQFLGSYCGAICRESARKAIENADVILSLGNLMTDIDLGAGTSRLDVSKMIIANSDKVRIKHHRYAHINLKNFIIGLRSKLPKGQANLSAIEHPSLQLNEEFRVESDQKLSISRFYQRINRFLRQGHVIITDSGDSLFCSAELYMPEGIEYVGQAFYLSIGFSVPAALGVKFAAKERRPVLFVGDGAFQMTAQELSTIIRHGQNPVIFVMNNDGYTIERVIYDGAYNDIQMWKYHMLPQVFGGGWGCEVKTEGELEKALEKANAEPDSLALIEVRLNRFDCSEALKKLGTALRK